MEKNQFCKTITNQLVLTKSKGAIIKFFKIHFSKFLLQNEISSLTFANFLNCNEIGEVKDFKPLIPPFVSSVPHAGILTILLKRFEIVKFTDLQNYFAILETKNYNLSNIEFLLEFFISQNFQKHQINKEIEIIEGKIDTLSNDYQENLSNMKANEMISISSAVILILLIQTSLQCMIQCSHDSNIDNNLDFITLALEKNVSLNLTNHKAKSLLCETVGNLLPKKTITTTMSVVTNDYDNSSVLFSYYILRMILTNPLVLKFYNFSQSNLNVNTETIVDEKLESKLKSFYEENFDELNLKTFAKDEEVDGFILLFSSTNLSKLLKGCLQTTNSSLKFLILDLCSLILSKMNIQLFYSDLNNKDVNLTNLDTSTGSNSSNFSNFDKEWDDIDGGLSDLIRIQLAAEYYVSVAKEKKLFQLFATTLKQEINNQRFDSIFDETSLNDS
jgi:hypothetical protein